MTTKKTIGKKTIGRRNIQREKSLIDPQPVNKVDMPIAEWEQELLADAAADHAAAKKGRKSLPPRPGSREHLASQEPVDPPAKEEVDARGELLDLMRQTKRQIDDLNDAYAQMEEMFIEQMDAHESKSYENRNGLLGTVVSGATSERNEAAIKKALTASTWRKIIVEKIDTTKLRKAMAGDETLTNIVATNTTEKPKKRYAKVTDNRKL